LFGNRLALWRAVSASGSAATDVVWVAAHGHVRVLKSYGPKPIFRDRGWRIFRVRVSGKRTVPRGQSRLIKANQGQKGVPRGWRDKLGHEVGERCGWRSVVGVQDLSESVAGRNPRRLKAELRTFPWPRFPEIRSMFESLSGVLIPSLFPGLLQPS
jgi:hypothetical protein